MKKTTFSSRAKATLGILLGLSLAGLFQAGAAPLINFPFNEGAGTNVTDTASGLVGRFGINQNPAVDVVSLIPASPSGQAGDGCITNQGGGFLLADDSVNPVLDLTNGPITIETWIFIDLTTPAKASEGIAAYGNSYKMGMKGGYQVFTLYGIVDITNAAAGQVPAGQWTHLAAAWEPGIGVHFYVNGQENFVANTNAAARPVANNSLSIASEGFGNNALAAFDRLRIHSALLSAADLDSDPLNPKAPLASTRVAYNFNETAFPCNSAVAPPRPTIPSSVFLPSLGNPAWTNDTPSGLVGDFALAFNQGNPAIRDRVMVDYGTTSIDLGLNNTNYTLQAWVKLPKVLVNERMVIYRTDGPAPRISLSINNNRGLHTTVLGNADFASSVIVPNDDRWHHIAAVMENNFGQVSFYLDGIFRQTMTRSSANVPSSGGTASLLVGMESDTRYFRGLLDRVRLDNSSLTADQLDFPAIPGLARVTAQPADITVNAGESAVFTAVVDSSSTASYQWRYRANRADLQSVTIAGATGTALTIPSVSLADQGFYFLAITNDVGGTETYAAKLAVRTAPGTFQRAWQILPGERTYITPYSGSAQTRDLERGMAYNPVTGHLLIGARWTSPLVKGIYIIDPATGSHVGELSGVSNIVSGGTIVLTRVGASDDGAIFACNFGSLTDANPLKIYRWANETAEPTVAYQGNPVSGIAANQQWGKNMIVRGSGVNTRILMDTRTTILALFTTTDGVNFTPTLLQAQARNDDWNAGLAWMDNNRVWGKNAADPLFEWYLGPATNGAALLRSFPDFPNDGFNNFSLSADGRYMAGLIIQPGPDSVELYDISDLNRGPVLVDTGFFQADNTQAVGYGNVLIVGNRVIALNPNNGIVAFDIVAAGPKLGIRTEPAGVAIYWDASVTGYVLESSPVLPVLNWSPVTHSVVGSENIAVEPVSGAPKFYRLRKQ